MRAYHGGAEIPKAHVARIRLAMRAEVDTWVCDRNGDGVLVWATPPGASLTGELRAVMAKIRAAGRPRALARRSASTVAAGPRSCSPS